MALPLGNSSMAAAAAHDKVRPLRPLPVEAGDADALPPGTRLGELEILEVLGIGGFGIVYLAEDHALQRKVAVKEYLPAQLALRGSDGCIRVRAARFAASFDSGLEAFANEARMLAGFDHAAMVKVHRYWEANGSGYMAMPFVEGATLGQARRGNALALREPEFRALLAPLLDALAMLHAQGVYHRDIAPDNILLRPDGTPLLLDFGSARRVIGRGSQPLTAVLKPRYAPIEQYGETAQVRQGPWTDLYALAGVIVFLLDGLPPPPATARAIHDDMLPLTERRYPGVSYTFLAAIDWALAVRPQDRPQSVAEFQAALDGRLRPPRRAGAAVGAWPLRQAGSLLAGTAALAFIAATWLAQPDPGASDMASLADAPAVEIGLTADATTPGGNATAEPPRALPLPPALPAAVPTAGLPAAGGANALPSRPAPQPAALRTAAPARLAPAATQRTAGPAFKTPRPVLGAKPARAKPVADANPQRQCQQGNFFMRAMCLNQQCRLDRYEAHPQCAYLRRDDGLLNRHQIAGR